MKTQEYYSPEEIKGLKNNAEVEMSKIIQKLFTDLMEKTGDPYYGGVIINSVSLSHIGPGSYHRGIQINISQNF